MSGPGIFLARLAPGAVLAASLFCALPAPAGAGPPFFTDDPEPVAYGRWEFYLASQYLKSKDGRSGTAPHAEVNYGAAPELQLHLIAPAAFAHPAGGRLARGYGDTELGAKYRFLRETARRPQAGVFAQVELPTGEPHRGLGAGSTQVFLPLWLQKSWNAWTTYGGAGCWVVPGAGKKKWFYAGWLLQRDLSEHLTLGGEVFRRTPDTPGGAGSSGFNGGGQVNFAGSGHLLFAAGRDFSGPARLTAYLGLQWTP